MKKGNGKKATAIIAASLVITACGVGLYFGMQPSQKTTASVAKEETVTRGSIVSSLTEEGSASVNTQTTGLDLNVSLDGDTKLDLSVTVEKILVRAGEEVKEGDALFVLNQTSLTKALNTLNYAYQEAQLKADDAILELKLGQATAEQSKISSENAGGISEAVFNNTITEMNNKLSQYEETLKQSKEDLEKYTQLLDLYNLRLATKNNLRSIMEHYEEALEALEDFYDDYNENNSSYLTTYKNYQNQLESLKTTMENAKSNMEDAESEADASKYKDSYYSAVDSFNNAVNIINKYQSVMDEYDTLEKRIEDAQECLKEAQETYNDYCDDYSNWYGNMTRTDLERKVKSLEESVASNQLIYDNYKLQYDSNVSNAESTKKSANLSAETAELSYQSKINKLQQTVLSTSLTAQNLYAYVQELNRCLDDNIIVSPCDGLITSIDFAAGDSIDLTKNVITIAKGDSITISLSIDQEDITNVKLDQEALVVFDTMRNKTFIGKVNAISVSPMSMGSPTVNYTITVLVESDDLKDIYEGMSCTVDLVANRVDNVLIVPKRAVTTKDGKNYVIVKQTDGSSALQEVELGFTDGSSYEVKTGLQEGDTILIGSSINSDTSNMTVISADNASSTGKPSNEENQSETVKPNEDNAFSAGERPSRGEAPEGFERPSGDNVSADGERPSKGELPAGFEKPSGGGN